METGTLFMAKFTTNGIPNSYTDQYPNNLPKYKECLPRRAPFIKLFGFPIGAVVHGTHTEEKRAICCRLDGAARFKANSQSRPAKVNKYIQGTWEEEKASKEVLPGKYVWFAMKPTLPNDPEFRKEDYNVYYVNGGSFYGPWSFTFDYSELISTYQEHIRNHTDPAKRDATVVLRNGGTLIYKREICYIVIVTHSKDTKHKDEEYPIILPHDDVLKAELCTFHPKCVPPPHVPKGAWIPQPWYGYDLYYLGSYDHISFAVNCDWDGEVAPMEKEGMHEDRVQLADDTEETASPILRIRLSAGEPHNYFEDCKDASEESYKSFHPRCHRAMQKDYRASCYVEEYRKWISTEMPTKIQAMAKNVENRMEEVTERDKRKATKRKAECIVDIAVEAVESATKCCNMTEKIIKEIDDQITGCVKKVKNEIEQIKDNITNRNDGLSKAKDIRQMALKIARSTEGEIDDDFAKKAKELAEKKSREAEQLIGDIMKHVGEMTGKMNEMAEEMGRLGKNTNCIETTDMFIK